MIEREEMLDISVHCLTALLNVRPPQTNVDDIVSESIEIATKLLNKVTEVLEEQK
jgi:hypothetical protein